MKIFYSHNQKNSFDGEIYYEDLLLELRDLKHVTKQELDYLMNNQHLIPKEWNDDKIFSNKYRKHIYFWDTFRFEDEIPMIDYISYDKKSLKWERLTWMLIHGSQFVYEPAAIKI